jgi:hypothetical protein
MTSTRTDTVNDAQAIQVRSRIAARNRVPSSRLVSVVMTWWPAGRACGSGEPLTAYRAVGIPAMSAARARTEARAVSVLVAVRVLRGVMADLAGR